MRNIDETNIFFYFHIQMASNRFGEENIDLEYFDKINYEFHTIS
jgi:hypothetical protein